VRTSRTAAERASRKSATLPGSAQHRPGLRHTSNGESAMFAGSSAFRSDSGEVNQEKRYYIASRVSTV
jgi:hypothetical protein